MSKETRALNDTLDQIYLTDIFRTLHPKATEYTFLSSAHGTVSKIDPILGHKTALTKYERNGIIPCTLSDHKAMKLDINHRKKSGRPPEAWRLKNTLLKNEWVNQAIREGIKKYMEINENENTTIQTLWIQQTKAVLRGKKYCYRGLSEETRKNPKYKKLTAHLKELEAAQQRHPKPSRRREIRKTRAEISNVESQKTVGQINATKSWFLKKES